MKALLVGEANPYGADPDYALYPLPLRASGDRLCTLVMELDRRDYLNRFDRVNLCPSRWSVREARASAERIRAEDCPAVVLLGAKVAGAFGLDFRPFTVVRSGLGECDDGRRFVILPHPSGLCRIWNEPRAFERARAALRTAGVL